MMACQRDVIPNATQPGDRYPGESVVKERRFKLGTLLVYVGGVVAIAGVCMRTTHLGIGLMLIGIGLFLAGGLLRETNEVQA